MELHTREATAELQHGWSRNTTKCTLLTLWVFFVGVELSILIASEGCGAALGQWLICQLYNGPSMGRLLDDAVAGVKSCVAALPDGFELIQRIVHLSVSAFSKETGTGTR